MGFVSSFFGKDQRRDLEAGYADSQRRLDDGRAESVGHLVAGRDRAVNAIAPYMQAGQRGQTAYENTLGLNGDAARQQQFSYWQADPAMAHRNNNNMLQMQALLRKYNAGPQGVNSGAATLGAGRLATEQFNNDWGGYLDRLMRLGQQGGQYAGQAGQWEYGTGHALSGNADTYANTSAANRINIANAMAQSRSTGINNLLGLAGVAAKAYGGGM